MVSDEVYKCCKNTCGLTPGKKALVFSIDLTQFEIDYNSVGIALYTTGGAGRLYVEWEGQRGPPALVETLDTVDSTWLYRQFGVKMSKVNIHVQNIEASKVIKYYICRKLATCCVDEYSRELLAEIVKNTEP